MEPFDDALAALDFDTAEALLAETPADVRGARKLQLEAAMKAAVGRARTLAHEIQQLARDNEFERLLSISDDPETARLLALLAPEIQRGSEVQLEGAHKWLEQRVSASRRHLRRAREAIAGYDTVRGRIELDRIRSEYLDDEERTEFEQLTAQMEAVELERMEIEVATQDVLSEHQATVTAARRRTRLVWGAVILAVVVVALLVVR